MDSYSLNIFRKDEGSVWQNRTHVNTTRNPILSVRNQCCCYEANTCKGARFVHAALDHTGRRLAAGDRHGHVYVFNLANNRFWLLIKLGSCCTAITFSPLDERDLLVAAADCSLHIFETPTRKHLAHLSNHKSCISHISVDEDGQRFLTCSLKTTLVWDLLTLTVLHELNFRVEENLIKSLFIPAGKTFLTVLKEDRLLMWDSSNFEYLQQFNSGSDFAIRTLDVSKDGCLVAAGGKASWLLVWSLGNSVGEDQPYSLSLHSANIQSVRQVAFFPDSSVDCRSSHILCVLSHEGTLHFYECETGTHLFKLTLFRDYFVALSTASIDSWRFVALTFSGQMQLYDLTLILRNKEKQDQAEAAITEEKGLSNKPTLPFKTSEMKDLVRLSDSTIARLKGIVKEFGHYPDKYRYLIWKSLLNLPSNEAAYQRLLTQPVHPAFNLLHQKYPLANRTVFRALQRILCCLLTWCPQLSEVDDLALLVFPFVKLFHQNLLLCFELILTFICNWCQNWFTHYPNPPFSILAATENILSFHDPILLLHFIRNGVTAKVYSWCLLKTVFSEVISKELWLQLFDHVFSNQPAFLLYIVVAFNVLLKQKLMNLSSPEEFKTFYQTQQSVSVKELVKKAYLMQKSTPVSTQEACIAAVGNLKPSLFTKHSYPVFTHFPTIQLDLAKENKQIQEELDYIKNRQEMLLNMQTNERVKVCQCSNTPGIIRHTTCACVVNPHGFSVGPTSVATSRTSSPTKRKLLSSANSILKEAQNYPHTRSQTVSRATEGSEMTTDVIRRVLSTREKLTQQKKLS